MNELVHAYRGGDKRAGDALFNRLHSYVGWLAKRYGDQTGYDREEAFGVALEALAEAINTWDPSRGHKYFYCYAKQRMSWAVSNGRNKHIGRQKAAYQAMMGDWDVADERDYEAQALASFLLSRLDMDGKRGEMLRLKALGYSNVQIGKRLGCSNQYVWRCLKEDLTPLLDPDTL